MADYSHAVGDTTCRFGSLKELMAKASPPRSGDCLAGIAAGSAQERVAAQIAFCCLDFGVHQLATYQLLFSHKS
jgi:ethanolamine ammonia-lyase large subunit